MSEILLGIHGMLAGITSVPELEMEKPEAERLGAAMIDVSAQYGSMGINPKTLAWIRLMMVCGSIYGPRIGALKLRKMMEAEERAKTPVHTQGVHNFSVV